MKFRHSLVACGIFFLAVLSCHGSSFIFQNGKTDYRIYVAPDATPAEKNAAAEFQKYWKLATGTGIAVSGKYTGNRQILIGLSQEAQKLLPGIDLKSLNNDEIIIAFAKDMLILCGERPRGTLYAVYEFMKKYMGIRFWTAKEESVPKSETIAMPEKIFRYAPPVKVRLPYFRSLLENPDFAAKMHCFGPNYTSSPEWGGNHVNLIGPWHTFDRFLPASQYLKSNPEYFSLRDGKRTGGQFQGQLCLSNPELRQKFLEIVREELRKNPDAKVISVSQNDNDNYCQCPECEKIDKAGKSPSASVISFVNFIAEHVEKEFPGVEVQTFAYQYSRTPPEGIVPRKNVSILLCAIEADFSKPLQTTGNPDNAAFLKDLKAWQKTGAKLAMWYYVSNFNNFLLPHPNLESLKKDVGFLGKLSPSMLLLECDAANINPIGDLLPLKVWIGAHLLWNPSLDPEKLEDEFLNGYYGKAAPYVKKYLDVRRADALRNPETVGCFEYTAKWVTPELLFQCLQILGEAQKAVAGTPVPAERISILSKPFEYLLISDYARWQKEKDCPPYAEAVKIARDYLDFLARCQVTHIASTNEIGATRRQFERFINYPPEKMKPHPFLAGFKNRKKLIFEEDAFIIHGDTHAEVVRDEKARNGWAIMLKHIGPSWAVQLPIRPEFNLGKSYEVYAACRLDKKAKHGSFQFGGYDLIRRELYINVHPDADTLAADRYLYIPLGTHRFRGKSYLFLDSKVNPEIQRSYVDHLLFVEK